MWIAFVLAVVVFLVLAFRGLGFLGWTSAMAVILIGWRVNGVGSTGAFMVITTAAIGIAVLFGLAALRRNLVSRFVMPVFAKVLPRLGDTERIALEAGTVWWDGDLFSGMPHWQKLLDFKARPLSDEEQAFLDGPVDDFCRRINDWDVYQRRDLSPETWQLIKDYRLFGLIIPKEYGGHGFSALAQSRIVTRISSRSVTAAVTVMVPNSLGPGELLMHYGTQAQKDRYLKRLADGIEIPCFALTGPEAGSDAAATQSEGIVEKRTIDGKEVLGLRCHWQKRYITLAPVATLIGLAFRLKDPDHLIGDIEDRGITCALIPRDTPGVEIGMRHDPMGVPFHNGPTVGRDVWIPFDAVIGEMDGVGNGWRMLMESLAAGRSISLPALSIGAAQMATRICGAYATVREQFDTPIGRFEGIEEPLARIAGMTYLMTATRNLTCGALDAGEKPAVIGSIAKAYLTDSMRQVVSDAMDIRAGSAIQRGPRNTLARAWDAVPIGITVEGANILTRSMIVYGQGAIRCHPFVQKEIDAVARKDLKSFDSAIFGHVNLLVTRSVRALLLALSGSRLAGVPQTEDTARYYQHLSRFSAAFTILSDTAMGTLGGSLKRREKISGRLADGLAYLYLASAALKRYHDEGKTTANHALVRWSVELCVYRVQEALLGVLENLPNRFAASLLGLLIFPLGARFRPPNDRIGARVARDILEDREARRTLTEDVFVPPGDQPGLGMLEAALDKAVAALPIETKLRDAVRAGNLDRAPGHLLDDLGLAAGVITQQEYDRLNEARDARDEVIQVDAFDPDVYKSLH
ncbi:acyl-CoA dehydrogenase [Dokdonella sp.]|uniref:acyl-CoA dehydrogenase n=1 Tax=Dokdonella sp. TaxID=2291710 RepID=UPI002B661E6C|nr:acyl-CoA dehydrogenase [Dokdonella sp.]HOX70618.1 acyl-CoA dehydrogenase [Dokdonella sp.]HOX71886.1 acyl-CoA dehydrogenase [Dokdonella sp.]HPN78015.1 acyl-CoA dehydrogenase [Dokdonella sp.]